MDGKGRGFCGDSCIGKRIVKSRVGEGSMATYCRDIAEDEEFEKTKTMLRLMCELNEGRRSGEEEGYLSAEEVRAYFRSKRK